MCYNYRSNLWNVFSYMFRSNGLCLRLQITSLAFASSCNVMWTVTAEIVRVHKEENVCKKHTNFTFMLLSCFFTRIPFVVHCFWQTLKQTSECLLNSWSAVFAEVYVKMVQQGSEIFKLITIVTGRTYLKTIGLLTVKDKGDFAIRISLQKKILLMD